MPARANVAISKEESDDPSSRGAKLPYNGYSDEFLDRLEPNGNIPNDKDLRYAHTPFHPPLRHAPIAMSPEDASYEKKRAPCRKTSLWGLSVGPKPHVQFMSSALSQRLSWPTASLFVACRHMKDDLRTICMLMASSTNPPLTPYFPLTSVTDGRQCPLCSVSRALSVALRYANTPASGEPQRTHKLAYQKPQGTCKITVELRGAVSVELGKGHEERGVWSGAPVGESVVIVNIFCVDILMNLDVLRDPTTQKSGFNNFAFLGL
uniref:Uncharacterized protein n=1 Tax=Timema monikensis TaxID=170555 RepID=A0A7R9E0H3_9NEOP|nr:unnamed protein product [Timema monikensis]